MASVIANKDVLRAAQDWLCRELRHPNPPTVVGVYSKVEMIDVSTFDGRGGQIPGPTHWYLDTRDRAGSVHTYEVPEYEARQMLDLINPVGEACMWCGASFQQPSERDAHEEVCGA